MRAGTRPEHLDYVIQDYGVLPVHLYAHKSYVDKHGIPSHEDDFSNHRFVGIPDNLSHVSFGQWFNDTIAPETIAVRSSYGEVSVELVQAGFGIGVMNDLRAGLSTDLVPILHDKIAWRIPLLLITHVDLHRTPKVQSMLQSIKDHRLDLIAG